MLHLFLQQITPTAQDTSRFPNKLEVQGSPQPLPAETPSLNFLCRFDIVRQVNQ